jgi:hypothetical protein
MRGVIPIVLVVGAAAFVGCGGSDDDGASQAELNQARREGAQQERQEERLRRLEQQLKNLKKGQKGKPPAPSVSPEPGTTSGSTSCGDDLTVGPATTCGFAVNVATDYYREIGSGSGTVQSFSPTTGQTYSMSCTGSPHVCTGGNNASVYFP